MLSFLIWNIGSCFGQNRAADIVPSAAQGSTSVEICFRKNRDAFVAISQPFDPRIKNIKSVAAIISSQLLMRGLSSPSFSTDKT